MSIPSYQIAVLVSGEGTNLQALIDYSVLTASFKIVTVISDNPNAPALNRAKKAGIPTHIIDPTIYPSRDDFDQQLLACLQRYSLNLIALAGYMRILTPKVIGQYENKIINSHPSLLPKYRGLHTYRRVLENGDREQGTTLHYVTCELDDGPIIAQSKFTIEKTATIESLKKRTKQLEHALYPIVIHWIATGIA